MNIMLSLYNSRGAARQLRDLRSSLEHLPVLDSQAASKLARTALINDTAFAAECDAALAVGRRSVDALLWNTSAQYFRAYTGGHAIMSDSLYAQVGAWIGEAESGP